MGTDKEKIMIAEAASKFPTHFRLRAFPGEVFRINVRKSYVVTATLNVMLCTDVCRMGRWLSFAKCYPDELQLNLGEAVPVVCEYCGFTAVGYFLPRLDEKIPVCLDCRVTYSGTEMAYKAMDGEVP